MSQLVTVEVMADESNGPLRADSYDYNRLPPELRDQAMLAQGTVLTKLGGAVERVIDAGNTLRWAKETLPHGEYLPWVQQACGLKPRHAQKLIKAAEFVNAPHVAHLSDCTDVATLFMLSADTTTEEVRQWFMERCAAGDVPSRSEVQERKRSAGQPREPQPTEALALTILRKNEVDRLKAALALAERAQVVAADQVMAEQRLRELGKQRFIAGADADFHRMKDGSWIRLPHAGRVDAIAAPQPHADTNSPETSQPSGSEVLSVAHAAERLGMTKHTLTQLLTPTAAAKRGGPLVRAGQAIEREGRGMVRLKPISPQLLNC